MGATATRPYMLDHAGIRCSFKPAAVVVRLQMRSTPKQKLASAANGGRCAGAHDHKRIIKYSAKVTKHQNSNTSSMQYSVQRVALHGCMYGPCA